MSSRVSRKAGLFNESVIREMTRLADEHKAINLAQGFPNFPAPDFLKEAAVSAIRANINQYAVTWGTPNLRHAVAEKYRRIYGWEVDPVREVTICCGATEGMIASVLALVDPGEQVLVFEPFYENYGPDAIIAGAVPVFVPMDPRKGWSFDPERLENAIRGAQASGGIRALILNTPNNPTGKVFTAEELTLISELACRYGFYVITDEIYEHIVYDGLRHQPPALLPGMRERTVTISGASKTFSVTGWRIGYITAPVALSRAIRKMHDFLTVGAAAPLQEAVAQALEVGPEFYASLAADYLERRDLLLSILTRAGFRPWKPNGAYYIMADISEITEESDVEFVGRLVRQYGVAAVPGSSFFSEPHLGRRFVRFAFCKTRELLEEAGDRLSRLAS